jgi:hypothetical protein
MYGVYVKLILSFLPVIHSPLSFFSYRYRSITFFSFFFLFFLFFSRFNILMTGREARYAMTLNVYIQPSTFLSVCLLSLFRFSCTMSIVRVRMTVIEGRRFFSSSFFFSSLDKVHLFAALFFLLPLSLSYSFF